MLQSSSLSFGAGSMQPLLPPSSSVSGPANLSTVPGTGPVTDAVDAPPELPLPADLAALVDKPAPASRTSRLQQWTGDIAHFFRPPANAAKAAQPAGVHQWRPEDPAFQHFHELIDGIGRAPDGDRAAIARALDARLRESGLDLPARQHSPAMTTGILLSPGWRSALGDGGLCISDLLGALGRCDEVDPGLRRELSRRLTTAFEITVNRLADIHPGIGALQKSRPAALRPLPDIQTRPPEPGPRMRAFIANVTRLVHNHETSVSTPGQLAARLLDCLRHPGNIPPNEEAALIGQIAPALEAIIHADPTARRLASRLREAAHRLESYLKVSACIDMAEPQKAAQGGSGLNAIAPRQARGFLLNRLLSSSLDPAMLSAHLRGGALREWLHPVVVDHPERQGDGSAAMAVLRHTLRPMLETGLIDEGQRSALMRQMKAHLQPSAGAAAS